MQQKTLDQMTASEIGFDSDCIDRRLSGPGAGQIDRVLFPQVDDDRQKLINLNKKFVLVQPPHMAEPELLPGEPQWIRWSREEGAEVVTGTRFDTNVTYPSFADIGMRNVTKLTNPKKLNFWIQASLRSILEITGARQS